jgi:hypothetical protein
VRKEVEREKRNEYFKYLLVSVSVSVSGSYSKNSKQIFSLGNELILRSKIDKILIELP